ncbi:MAG: FMN-binding protein [Mycobacteriales bacterium]
MRRVVLTVLATITGLVLLLGFKSHGGPHGGIAALGVASAPPKTAGQSPQGTASTTPHPTAHTTSPTPSAQNTPATVRTVTGRSADTRYGPVQVVIRVAAGRITQVGVTQVPLDTSRDRAINTEAVPQLDQEALAAQSANIDSVSGASYTSQGYVTSLQSALDAAGIG